MKTMSFKVGQKVCAIGNCIRPGKVIGYGFIGNQPIYIIELDNGFYSEDKETFVSRMLVHGDNLGSIVESEPEWPELATVSER